MKNRILKALKRQLIKPFIRRRYVICYKDKYDMLRFYAPIHDPQGRYHSNGWIIEKHKAYTYSNREAKEMAVIFSCHILSV